MPVSCRVRILFLTDFIKSSIDSYYMPRKIEVLKNALRLTDNKIEGIPERVVTPIETSAKADIPKKYLKSRVYVIITRDIVKD